MNHLLSLFQFEPLMASTLAAEKPLGPNFEASHAWALRGCPPPFSGWRGEEPVRPFRPPSLEHCLPDRSSTRPPRLRRCYPKSMAQDRHRQYFEAFICTTRGAVMKATSPFLFTSTPRIVIMTEIVLNKPEPKERPEKGQAFARNWICRCNGT